MFLSDFFGPLVYLDKRQTAVNGTSSDPSSPSSSITSAAVTSSAAAAPPVEITSSQTSTTPEATLSSSTLPSNPATTTSLPTSSSPSSTSGPVTQDQDNSGLSDGAIAGIVVGSVAGAILACIAIFFLIRRRRSPRASPQFEANNSHGDLPELAHNETAKGGFLTTKFGKMKSKSNLSNTSYDTDPLPEQTNTSTKQMKDSSTQSAPSAARKSDAASGLNAESDIDDVPELRQVGASRPSTPPPIPQRSSWRPSSIGSPTSPRSPSSLNGRYDLPAEQLEYGSRPGSAVARQEATGRLTPSLSRGHSRAGSTGSMNPEELARLKEEQARLQERKRRLQEMHEIEEMEAEIGRRISLIEESGLPH